MRTGASLIASSLAVRAQRPATLIAAMAVTSPGALTPIGVEADEVVCLEALELFYAVGQSFEDFPKSRMPRS